MNTTPPTSLIPTADEVLRNPAISYWLKDALLAALERDPVQAANDAQLLFDILDAHASVVVERSIRHAQSTKATKL